MGGLASSPPGIRAGTGRCAGAELWRQRQPRTSGFRERAGVGNTASRRHHSLSVKPPRQLKAAPLGPGTCKAGLPGEQVGELAFLNSAPALPLRKRSPPVPAYPRPPSPRGAARPQRPIGCGCDEGGNWPGRFRWRRPGVASSRVGRKGKSAAAAGSAPAWLRPLLAGAVASTGARPMDPTRRDSTGREALPFTFFLPASTFLRRCLTLHHLPSSSSALSRQSPGKVE